MAQLDLSLLAQMEKKELHHTIKLTIVIRTTRAVVALVMDVKYKCTKWRART